MWSNVWKSKIHYEVKNMAWHGHVPCVQYTAVTRNNKDKPNEVNGDFSQTEHSARTRNISRQNHVTPANQNSDQHVTWRAYQPIRTRAQIEQTNQIARTKVRNQSKRSIF